MPGTLALPSARAVCGQPPVPRPTRPTAATATRLASADSTGIHSSSLSCRTTCRLVLNRSHERAKRPMAGPWRGPGEKPSCCGWPGAGWRSRWLGPDQVVRVVAAVGLAVAGLVLAPAAELALRVDEEGGGEGPSGGAAGGPS